MARSAARATSRSAARARARASKKTDEETDEGTFTQNIGEICTQNIGERNGKANEKSEPEERRRDLPEWGETLASETRRTRGLVGSEGPEDPGTEGIREW